MLLSPFPTQTYSSQQSYTPYQAKTHKSPSYHQPWHVSWQQSAANYYLPYDSTLPAQPVWNQPDSSIPY